MKAKSKKTNVELEDLSVSDFFENVGDFEDEESEKEVKKPQKKVKSLKKTPKVIEKTNKKLKKKKKVVENSDESSEDEENVTAKVSNIKKSMKNLEKSDPELFKFLEQNDKKLMKFNVDDEGSDDDEKTQSDEEVHKPGELEVASDEDDYEPEEGGSSKKSNAITLKTLREWQTMLTSDDVSVETIRNVIKAFNCALISISGDTSMQGEYIVEGSAIFNGVIQLCVLYIEKAIRNYLKLSPKANFKDIKKCKRFSKVKSSLRCYLTDLSRLLEMVSSTNILSVLLKHLHQISSVLAAFNTITKPVLKRLIQIWSTGEESLRIVAFLCILKITRNQQEIFLNQVLKTMYMEYVKNSKFVSPNSLAAINFMRRSLTELFLLDINTAYHHVFLFIRQLAIHLRNAILLQKKEHFQQIYNWQYVNSLKLWGDVLSTVSMGEKKSEKLQALIYPLVSIINGVIKLKSSAHYFPLRFHCVKMLIDLSRSTKVFIPILPYILEVLNSTTFNQQHKKLAMKPLSFTCILRIQKGHLDENSFRDEVVEQVYNLTLETLINECTSIAFPDLVVPHVMSLNHFIKNTKNPNYAKKLKPLVEKIMEQSKYIDERRNKITFSLNDANFVKSWEINLKTGQTPLEVYYEKWQKTHQTKLKRQKVQPVEKEEGESSEGEDHDYGNLPKIKAQPKQKKARTDEPVELFPSDDEDDGAIDFDVDSDNSFENDSSEDEREIKRKNKKNAKQQQNGKSKKKNEVVSEDDEEMSEIYGNEDESFMEKDDIVEDVTDW